MVEEDGWLVMTRVHAKRGERVAQFCVPASRSLFGPLQRLVQLPHHAVIVFCSWRWFHVQLETGLHLPVHERSLHVEVARVPAQTSGDGKQAPEGYKPRDWGITLEVVFARDLREPFRADARLEAFESAVLVEFLFEHPPALHDVARRLLAGDLLEFFVF